MSDVHGETQFGRQTFRGTVEQVGVGRLDRAARGADHVQMRVLGSLVDRCALAQVRVPDQAEPLQEFERAVDRRGVGRGAVGPGFRAQPGADVLGRRVLERRDRRQHLPPLGGQPQPALAQPFGERSASALCSWATREAYARGGAG